MERSAISNQFTQAIAAAVAPAVASTPKAAGEDFVATLEQALRAVSASQTQATEMQRQFQLENPDVSLEDTMIAVSKSQVSFQAAVQVRNRLVQAYESVMNMQV
jgi:flagellar hook-basal body complex protein FliE